MDAVHSGTGVFYQAMPAVGADGKNIMKLIPVQMVNGRFVQTPTGKSKTNLAPQKAFTVSNTPGPIHLAEKEIKYPATEQFIKNHFSFVNASPSQVTLVVSNSVNKPPLQQQTVNLKSKVPQMAAPSSVLEKLVRLPSEFPLTVKSPALPRGQYLRIPPNAQVQRVPASELPPGIKEQIFTSSASSSVTSSSPSVVLVSPVTTVNQGVLEPSGSSAHEVKLLPKTSSTTSCALPLKRVKPHLKLIPKVSQRPNSPTRWVIEEVDSSLPENLRPLNSPSVPSHILGPEAEGGRVLKQTTSQSSQGKNIQGQENALVVCNGKVFFVAKTGGSTFKSTAARECSEVNQNILPSSYQQSAAPKTNPEFRTPGPGQSNEVIDLCDDDEPQEDLCQQATHLDEDNVIFVSYIPPKSESGSTKDVTLKTQVGLSEVTDPKTSSGFSRAADISAPRRGQSKPIRQGAHSDTMSQQNTSTQPLDSMEVDAATASPADSRSRGEHAETENASKTETSPLVAEPCQISDHLLRKMFGITADVRICLQKADEAGPGCFSADLLHTESIRLVAGDLKPNIMHHNPVNVPSVKVQTEHSASGSPHTSITPVKRSHSKLKTKHPSGLKENCCCSGQSSLNQAESSESEPVISYVEPIDEDFPDENDNPKSQDAAAHSQTQTCLDINTSTRRVGRTRKRPMCPCCIPPILHPVVKSSARIEEQEECTLTTEHANKKVGRPKAQRKDGRTSLRISCMEAKSKQNYKTPEVPSSDGLELHRREQSERLNEIL